jgi:16S rRNA processing protein RimM
MQNLITVGVITGAFGVQGAIKVKSFCDPPEQIFKYKPWQLQLAGSSSAIVAMKLRASGDQLIARLPDVDSKEAADALRGAEIQVDRSQFPPAKPGEYYWADLIGLRVVNQDGVDFGVVSALFETGANDVLVVQGERERWLPFTLGTHVLRVDLSARQIDVDWDPEF